MNAHMSNELNFLAELFPTHGASMRFDASVCIDVQLQCVGTSKTLLAHHTHERSLARMNSHVFFQVVVQVIALTAVMACE